jgi:hypothetical protein
LSKKLSRHLHPSRTSSQLYSAASRAQPISREASSSRTAPVPPFTTIEESPRSPIAIHLCLKERIHHRQPDPPFSREYVFFLDSRLPSSASSLSPLTDAWALPVSSLYHPVLADPSRAAAESHHAWPPHAAQLHALSCRLHALMRPAIKVPPHPLLTSPHLHWH